MARTTARSFQCNALLILTLVATSHAYSKPSKKHTRHAHQALGFQGEALVESDGRVSMPTFSKDRPEHLQEKTGSAEAETQTPLKRGSESHDRMVRSAKSGKHHSLQSGKHHSLLEEKHELGHKLQKHALGHKLGCASDILCLLCNTDCKWNNWMPWTKCTETCGGGSRERKRTIGIHCVNSGNECTGPGQETGMCNEQDCPTTVTTTPKKKTTTTVAIVEEEEEETTTTQPPKTADKIKSNLLFIVPAVVILLCCGGLIFHHTSKEKAKAGQQYDEWGEPIDTVDLGAEDYDYGGGGDAYS